MSKYILVTKSVWPGTKTYHEIDGDHENKEEALEAFGGFGVANDQAFEDCSPQYYIVKKGIK